MIYGNCSIPDCTSCASPAVCNTCRVGYSPASDSSSCQANPCTVSNCLYCDPNGACQRCMSSYGLSGGNCVVGSCSLPNCLTCKPGSQFCDDCQAGFMLNIWTNQCENNYKINVTGCLTFLVDPSGQFRCQSCTSGLIPSSDYFTCLTNCPPGCQTCASTTLCTLCKPGYSSLGSGCSPNSCTAPGCIRCNAD